MTTPKEIQEKTIKEIKDRLEEDYINSLSYDYDGYIFKVHQKLEDGFANLVYYNDGVTDPDEEWQNAIEEIVDKDELYETLVENTKADFDDILNDVGFDFSVKRKGDFYIAVISSTVDEHELKDKLYISSDNIKCLTVELNTYINAYPMDYFTDKCDGDVKSAETHLEELNSFYSRLTRIIDKIGLEAPMLNEFYGTQTEKEKKQVERD